MNPSPGQMLAHYRLTDEIGEGGMGVVWKAQDTTLDREVAIKILPETFASDRERLSRFEREAKVLASLNHGGIASIYGLHEVDGIHFLALEYVPGESLAERLRRGPVPVDEALDVARQIAEALEVAHENGVVHRDLKPANVVVTPDGHVKLLDFGLAKALSPEPVSGDYDLSMSPTITAPGTLAGMILGTAAYMSPEQARGGRVDRRADIWAFGVVLLEMLTGKRAFEESTVTDTLAAVLRADVDVDAVPAGTPAPVRRLIHRCLDRDPHTRLRDVGEARITLSGPDPVEDGVFQPPARSRTGLWLAVAVATLVAGAVLGRVLSPQPAPPASRFAFDVALEDHRLRPGSIALSPDGRSLVMQAQREDGNTELWLRPLSEHEARLLPGTVGGRFPFWSPDSREIGFFAQDQLLRLALDGTSPRKVCSVSNPSGGSWNQDGAILLGADGKGVQRVDATGGDPVEITTVAEDEEEHVWPVFLPDGDHYVFLADANSTAGHRIYLGRMSTGETTPLKSGIRSSVGYDPQMGVLMVERQQLMAYALDLDRRELTNEAFFVTDSMSTLGVNHHAPFSVSRNGVLATQHGGGGLQMLRVTLEGEVVAEFGDVDRYGNPAVSPDGRRVLFEIFESSEERLVWMYDFERGVRTPISQRNCLSDSGAWSADGRTVYFDSDAGGEWVAYKRAADGGAEPVLVGGPEGLETAVAQCSNDGQWLLVITILTDHNHEVYLGRLDSDGLVTEWRNWTNTPDQRENFAMMSPDSRYITYVSDVSGREEVYVAPVDGGPARNRWQVSTHGGVEPQYSSDGRFILYRSLGDHLVSVSVEEVDGMLRPGVPQEHFRMREPDLPYYRNSFDPFPGSSDLFVTRPVDETGAAIRVRTGWWPSE